MTNWEMTTRCAWRAASRSRTGWLGCSPFFEMREGWVAEALAELPPIEANGLALNSWITGSTFTTSPATISSRSSFKRCADPANEARERWRREGELLSQP